MLFDCMCSTEFKVLLRREPGVILNKMLLRREPGVTLKKLFLRRGPNITLNKSARLFPCI